MHKQLCLVARLLCLISIATFFTVATVANVNAQESGQTVSTGTVISWTRNTIVIQYDNGEYHLFSEDRDTARPATIPAGSRVQVTSVPSRDPRVRLAVSISITGQAPAAPSKAAQDTSAIPTEVRTAERAVERTARRYHLGFQGGIALDPELIAIGVNSTLGPVFSRNLYFRPNVAFEYGEVTRLFAINAEVVYTLPGTRTTNWTAYFGGGPVFNFVQRSFSQQGTANTNSGINFSDFNYDSALNIILGLQNRNGLFTEIKASVYAAPAPPFRLVIGYTF